MYSHALPAGYVIDREQAAAKALLGHEEGLGIEEIIEQERLKLQTDKCTPVTYENFLAWKERKKEKLEKEL